MACTQRAAPSSPPPGMRGAVPAYLVEDNPVIRANLTATLEELCGVNVVGSADSEIAAITWLGNPRNRWRIAVVDVFLRTGSGLRVLAGCQPRRPGHKIVVVTNYATADIRAACLALGADAVFDKSNELEALIDWCAAVAGMPGREAG